MHKCHFSQSHNQLTGLQVFGHFPGIQTATALPVRFHDIFVQYIIVLSPGTALLLQFPLSMLKGPGTAHGIGQHPLQSLYRITIERSQERISRPTRPVQPRDTGMMRCGAGRGPQFLHETHLVEIAISRDTVDAIGMTPAQVQQLSNDKQIRSALIPNVTSKHQHIIFMVVVVVVVATLEEINALAVGKV